MENITLVASGEGNKQVVLPKMPKAGPREVPLHVKFLTAGVAACAADLITFPLDTAKVRLQIQGESTTGSLLTTSSGASGSSHLTTSATQAAKSTKYRGLVGTICTITKQEGPRALYNGLAPGLQRQMCFASVRIGLYDSVKQIYSGMLQSQGLAGPGGFGVRILAGCTTGALAVSCAQPTDVVKVRMQAQKANMPKRYNGVFHAYRTIAVQEGVRGLWKGTSPNIARNCIVNCSELVSYDLFKEFLLTRAILSDSFPCHVVSAFGAGFVTTIIGSPVDVVKTRFMNSADGTYKGVVDCALSMARQEGPAAFYKGFMPSFMRLASWNVVMFVCYEQLKSTFSKPAPVLPKIEIETKRFL